MKFVLVVVLKQMKEHSRVKTVGVKYVNIVKQGIGSVRVVMKSVNTQKNLSLGETNNEET